ncbi:MAG: type II toxin-antitoxin system ParD family antitoxin [Rhizobiales bacterium]|nr:type II toxin-antitoxin system ParD family antitoxin [Hyphomicrobiales bacterium]
MSTTEKLSITLPRDMVKMIRDKVGSGSYASNSEVIREALRLLQDQESLRAQKLQALRDKVARSIESDEPSIPAEEVFERLEQRHRERAGKS